MRLTKPDNWVRGQQSLLPYIPIPSTYSSETNFFQTGLPFAFTLFTGKTAVTTGTSDPYFEVDTLGRNNFALQVAALSGQTYNATVLLEGTLNPGETDSQNDWATIETVTSAGIVQFTGLYAKVRASITAYTSGTLTARLLMQRV